MTWGLNTVLNLHNASALLSSKAAQTVDATTEVDLPFGKLVIALGLIAAIAIGVVVRRKMSDARDRQKEEVFQAHSDREAARAEFDAELKEAVTRASSEDLSFVVLRRLLARVKKTLPHRACAALVRFPDGETADRLVCPDPRTQSEFEAIVKAYEQPLKNVSWSGNNVTLTLRPEVARWTAQTLAVLPIPIPKPGFGILLISREVNAQFGADELDDASDFAKRAIDSMELARHEAEEKSDREIDKLTQVYNRAAIELRAATGFAEALKARTNISVLWIELDKFRVFAKDAGQEKADAVLKTIAQRISRTLERGQVLGRWDNHEFVILMPTVPEFQAQKLADNLVTVVAREINLNAKDSALHMTASIGCAAKFPSDTHFTKIMDRAAKGKDQAKYQGGNTSRRGSDEASGGVNFKTFQ
jgi:diguanylate cyclase (GGDEF)-like protein